MATAAAVLSDARPVHEQSVFFFVGSSFEEDLKKKFPGLLPRGKTRYCVVVRQMVTRRLACCTRKISANSWPASAVTRPRIVCLSSSIKFYPRGHEKSSVARGISGFNPRILRNIAGRSATTARFFNYMQNQNAGVAGTALAALGTARRLAVFRRRSFAAL